VLAHQTQKNLTNAREYFREHLQAGDYYSGGQRIRGRWFGAGARRLGLSSEVKEEEFLRLCQNRHPLGEERLTVRMMNASRRIFEDFVFSPPKSVSLAALLSGDERVSAAHRSAVTEALVELEKLAGCRVRKGRNDDSDRPTGNIAAVCFDHETSRLLDPQLHTHCIVFNATWDSTEQRWKALQNHAILRDRLYLTEVYRNRLASELYRIGYELDHTPSGFEIRGISTRVCERFSKRREQIEEIAGEVAARKAGSNIHEIRDVVAHRVRDRKFKEQGRDELLARWQSQLSDEEIAELAALPQSTGTGKITSANTKEALAWGIEHAFERKSVVRERELCAAAIVHARGKVDLNELWKQMARQGFLRTAQGEVATRAMLEMEWDIITWAREGRGASAPLNPSYVIAKDSALSDEQRAAVSYLLGRPDEVMIFRGGAGTGKSFTLQEVKRGLGAAGREVVVLAPQRKQVMALQADGFSNAETVAAFLQKDRLSSGCVVMVDEAGLLSLRDMYALMLLVRTKDCALILSGDTRQHSGVEAGDALRAIERFSGIGWVSLESIRRQHEWAMRRLYRSAVAAISEGRIAEGYRRFEKAGAIAEHPAEERYAAMGAEFLRLRTAGKSCLAISPTWREITTATEAIRAELISNGVLGSRTSEYQVLENLDLTEAQKSGGPRWFEADCRIVFHRKCGRIARNEVLHYARHEGTEIVAVSGNGMECRVDARAASSFSVMRKRKLEIRGGESLLIQANSESADGRKLANGELVQVRRLRKKGGIELSDGRIIPAAFRQFAYGYAVTSHAAQGLTVDHVLLAMDSKSGPAVNRKQFYVSSSRGREGLRIYTDDAETLARQIERSGQRPLAMEVAEAARELQIRPSIAARLIRRPISKVRALARLVAWRAGVARRAAESRSIKVDLWQ